MNSTKNMKLKIRFIVLLLALLLNFKLNATTYYISNGGNDDAAGTSSGTAWATISKINSTTLQPGDSVLFERDGTWRETVEIDDSGEEGNHIVYSAYGTGEKPRLLGSEEITSWTNVSGNIWSGDQTISTHPITVGYGAQIFFTNPGDTFSNWGIYNNYQADFANLTEEFEWTWNSNTIYIYSPTDPNSRYSNVECPQRLNEFNTNTNGYFSISHLYIGYLVVAGVRDVYGSTGLEAIHVTNCEIAYIGTKDGAQAFGLSVWHSDSYFAYNEIHDCGRRSISINMYDTQPIGEMTNVLIEHNHFYHGWHTTGVDCINSGGHTMDNITVRNNLFEGSPDIQLGGINPNSNAVFFADQSAGSVGTISNIYIYNNIFTYGHGKSISFEHVDTAYVVFNTFYGWNPTLSNGQAQINFGSTDNDQITIKNNIFYHDRTEESNRALECIFMASADNVSAYIDNNLYYATDPNVHILEFFQTQSYDREYRMDYWGEYRSQYPSYDPNSPDPADPQFVNAPNDLRIISGSPAIGAGTPILEITTDYLGQERDPIAPTIGAIEYLCDSSATDIVYFYLPEQNGSAIIDPINHTVTMSVVYGTSLTSLSPEISCLGATINPESGIARNFTTPQTYTVTALNGIDTQDWTITITVALSDVNDILAFSFPDQIGNTVINTETHTIEVTVPPLTDPTNLIPTITIADVANIVPTSGVAQDFSSSFNYLVTAQNGSEQTWTIIVTVQLSTETDILTFSLPEQNGQIYIDKTSHNVHIGVNDGTDLTNLTPTITVSERATIDPVSGVARDFNSPVIYTITAENDTVQQIWIVTVIVGNGISTSYTQDEYTIYPNPTKDLVNILVKNPPSSTYSIQLYDLQGNLVYKNMNLSGNLNKIQTGNLAPGMYIIELVFENLEMISKNLVIIE